jgi:hypothetical protein
MMRGSRIFFIILITATVGGIALALALKHQATVNQRLNPSAVTDPGNR